MKEIALRVKLKFKAKINDKDIRRMLEDAEYFRDKEEIFYYLIVNYYSTEAMEKLAKERHNEKAQYYLGKSISKLVEKYYELDHIRIEGKKEIGDLNKIKSVLARASALIINTWAIKNYLQRKKDKIIEDAVPLSITGGIISYMIKPSFTPLMLLFSTTVGGIAWLRNNNEEKRIIQDIRIITKQRDYLLPTRNFPVDVSRSRE